MIELVSQPTADEGLRCPACEYNLTGLVGSVCPECGGSFDRDQLLAELAGAPMPIPIWSQRDSIGTLRAFVRTVVEIWIHPVRFAAGFPQNPQLREPVVFARWCLPIAIIVCMLPVMVVGKDFVRDIYYISFTLVLGTAIVERLIAGAIFMPITRLTWEEAWYTRGLALMRMTRAFLILSCICTSLGCLLDASKGNRTLLGEYGELALMLTLAYWYVSLLRIATAYRHNLITFINTLLVVPVVVLAGAIVSTLCAGLIGQMLF